MEVGWPSAALSPTSPWSFGLGPWSVLGPWRPWSLVLGPWSRSRHCATTRYQEPRTKDQGPTKDEGPGSKDQGPRTKDQGRRVTLSGSQVLVEPLQRAPPGQLGCRFVVARRGVVVEAVIGLGIDVAFVRNIGCLQCRVVRRPRLGQTRIELAMVNQNRRLDLRNVCCWRRTAVERNSRSKIRDANGQHVGDPSAKTEPDRAQSARAVGTGL